MTGKKHVFAVTAFACSYREAVRTKHRLSPLGSCPAQPQSCTEKLHWCSLGLVQPS